MAKVSSFRFSMGRLMVEVGLLALPFGLFGQMFRNSALAAPEIAILLVMAAWFVFVMEVTYWCFLRPQVIQPIARQLARRRESTHDENLENERSDSPG